MGLGILASAAFVIVMMLAYQKKFRYRQRAITNTRSPPQESQRDSDSDDSIDDQGPYVIAANMELPKPPPYTPPEPPPPYTSNVDLQSLHIPPTYSQVLRDAYSDIPIAISSQNELERGTVSQTEVTEPPTGENVEHTNRNDSEPNQSNSR